MSWGYSFEVTLYQSTQPMKMISSGQKGYLFHNLPHPIKEVRQDGLVDLVDTKAEEYSDVRKAAHR